MISVTFLEQLRPGGPWLLIAINPDGPGIEGTTAHSVEEADAFMRRYNGRWNLYYSLNPARGLMNKKPEKTDIARIEFICVDLDPKSDETPEAAKARYLPQLEVFQPQATATIDSGNGIHGLWRLGVPITLGTPEDDEKIKDAEARGRELLIRFGAKTGTQNIDRILRLPGTTNLPDAKKRKEGRVRCEAYLISMNGVTCALEDFPKPEQKKTKAAGGGGGGGGTQSELPRDLELMLFLTGDAPAGYESRSVLLWKFIHSALRKGVEENTIIRACLDPKYAGNSIYEHVHKIDDAESYIKRQIEHAINASDLPQGDKRIIRMADGNLHMEWRMTEAALLAARCPVFVRARSLVQPLWRFEDTGEGNRQVLNSVFVKYNIPRLTDVVGHHAAIFQKYDNKIRRWRNIDPPEKIIKALIEMGHWCFFDVSGIITAPTMRRDGSLITEPGYDSHTQLWYKPASDIKLPKIGETRKEAQHALTDLNKLIEECAFISNVDWSVALAAMLTVVLRGAFTMAPLFFFHKPEPGTGGSYLTKIISTIPLGREAVPLNVSDDKKEFVKELSAAAYEGRPILNLNNLSFDLKSPLLSQMISECVVDIRPFGKNTETVRCDCRYMTVIANGNNVKVVGELVRRTLTARLDTKLECPEMKPYKADPLAAIQRDRSKYLAAILTIARAYLQSGENQKVKNINGLEQWSRFVQQPLVWLGEADPVKSQEDARKRDPDRGALRTRILAVVNHFQGGRFTAKDVHDKASKFFNGEPVNRDLFDAFSRHDGKGLMDAPSIGTQLSKDEGRVINNFSIHVAYDVKGEANQYVIANGESPM